MMVAACGGTRGKFVTAATTDSSPASGSTRTSFCSPRAGARVDATLGEGCARAGAAGRLLRRSKFNWSDRKWASVELTALVGG